MFPDLTQHDLNTLNAFIAVAAVVAAAAALITAAITFWAVRSGNRNAEKQLSEARELSAKQLVLEKENTEKQLALARETFERQNESYKLSVGAEWLFKLDDQFDSGPFRSKRRSSAISLRNKAYDPILEDVWDFFDTVGLLVRKGVLDEEMIWSRFFHWINGYWKASKQLLEERRGDEKQVWNDFENLFERVTKWEEKERSNSADLEWDDNKIQEFLDEESM
jgi:hypothetical protein